MDITDDEQTTLPGNQVEESQNFTTEEAPSDPERIKQEEAATTAQAAFRGYLVIFFFFFFWFGCKSLLWYICGFQL